MKPKAYCFDCGSAIYDSEDQEFCVKHRCPCCSDGKDADSRFCETCKLSTTELI